MIAQVRSKGLRKPTVFTVDAGGGDAELAAEGAALQAALSKEKLPAYPSVQRAARALMHLYRYHAWRRLRCLPAGQRSMKRNTDD
jgi:acyl-CoA synthetase (NDP forming)